MTKSPARLIALALLLALCTATLSIESIHPALAEETAASTPSPISESAPKVPGAETHAAAPAQPPKAPSNALAAAPTPPGALPSEAPAVTPTPPGPPPSEALSAVPTPAAPSGTPAIAPTPPETPPSEAPAAVPTPAAPSGTPAITPSPEAPPPEAPTAIPTPSESPPSGAPAAVPTPESPLDAQTVFSAEAPSEVPDGAGAYRVSPGEAARTLGSLATLTFEITPPGAPFIGVENVECAYADGVATIGPEALDALGEGEHILAFLFADGAHVEARLNVSAAKVAAKGSTSFLIVGGTTFDAEQLSVDRSSAAQHWTWNAAADTLTLDGYAGGEIRAFGAKALTIATAAGSVNTIASSGAYALSSSRGLILKGGGALHVTNDSDTAMQCEEGAIIIEGGTVIASGKVRAFHSGQDEIRISGGVVEVRHAGRRGDGFSAGKSTRVNGGSVTVVGADAAFGSLVVGGGKVTIRDCRVGASGGLSASGGAIAIEGVAESAAVSKQAMRFESCALAASGCGAYGLCAGGGLTVGKGASLRVEAERIALYAPTGAIKIEKGAALDLNGGDGALRGSKVLIGGKAYTGAHNHVVIENGAILRRENALQSLTAGGRTYGASSLSGDLAGVGWAWAASSGTLTLSGYDGGPIRATGGPVALSLQGENRVDGDLTVSGAVVAGGGALTAARISGAADLEIRSGTVRAARIALGGALSVSGGAVRLSGDGGGPAVECRSFSMTGGELILSAPGDSKPAGIRASGAAAIRGGSVTVENFGDFLRASGDVTIAGGSISIEGTGEGIASGKAIKVTGGGVSIRTAGCALTAKTIAISGKPSLRLESATRAAFDAKSVKIAGKAHAPRYPGVIIAAGKLVEGYKLLPDLIIGGREFSMKELNAGNRSGDGWSWSAKKNVLTLSGYHGEGIWINRKLTVALAAGTANSGSGDFGGAAIHSTENLTLTGSGRWSGALYGEGSLKVSGSPSISADAIRFRGGVALLGGRIQAAGDVEAQGGDVRIENSRVTAGRVRGPSVKIVKSSLTTTARGSEAAPDLMGDGGLVISSSIVFCTRFGTPRGKVKISGSPVFQRGSSGGEEVWTLAQSVSIARDMAAPPGKNCSVPAGRTLSVAKGKRLFVYGGLAVDGTLKGAVVRRSEAGRVTILGGAQVARGRSVRLFAEVVPASPGGQADQAVSWSSDGPGRLSVSGKGVVTATAHAKPGDAANITCRALDGTYVQETLQMTVTDPVARLTILHGGAPAARLSVPRSAGLLDLDVRVEPGGASGRVQWASSNPKVARVDPDAGAVRLLKKGTATITCAATDGTNAKAAVKLTVK